MSIGNSFVGDIEQLLLNRVIQSGQLFRFTKKGKRSYVHTFEKEVAAMYDNRGCLLLPSATLGFLSILKSIGLPPKSQVLIAPFGWLANYSVLEQESLCARFIPLDRDLSITLDAFKETITSQTRAVVVAHMMGRAQSYIAEIAEICKKKGLILIEDISQSFGVRHHDQLVGTFGDFAYTSFNHHKILSTGDGGLVIVKDQGNLEKIQSLHDQGNVIKNGRRSPSENPHPGFSLRVNELTGAVALAQLTRFNLIKSRIRKIYTEVRNELVQKPGVELLQTGKGDLPYTCLFRYQGKTNHDLPDLNNSGGHSVVNIPFLADTLKEQCINHSKLKDTFDYLSSIYSIGTGFIDKYFSTPQGIPIHADAESRDLMLQELKTMI